MSEKHAPSTRVGGLVWLIGGGAAWIAAFILMLEYLAELRRQTPLISCDLSSTISCSPNQASPMGNLLGIPAALAGATGLVLFFQFFTLTVSHVLCPNCEVVWCVTIPMLLYTAGWTLRAGAWGDAPWTRRAGAFLLSWWWVIAIAELLLALLLFQLVFNVFGL
jgi:uncharacterized membrane protein